MKNIAIAGIAVGSLLTLAPLWGFLGTLFGMIYSFQEVEAAQTTPDPSALAVATWLPSGIQAFRAASSRSLVRWWYRRRTLALVGLCVG